MFPAHAAAIFLVNRPCAARHCPATTVIAGLAPCAQRKNCPRFSGFATIAAQERLSSPGLTRRSIARRSNSPLGAEIGERSNGKLGLLPPPLWGRGGEGGRCCFTRCVRQLLPPPPTPPHKGEGSTPSARQALRSIAREGSASPGGRRIPPFPPPSL